MKFKGPAFPSYFSPRNPDKQIKVWNPHQGRSQRLRVLRQKCRKILDDKDVFVAATGQRLVSIVQAQKHIDEKHDVEYSILMLMAAGVDLAKDKGVSWVSAMNQILDGAAQQQHKVRMRIVEEADGAGEQGQIHAGEQGGPGTPEGGSSEGEERLHDVQRDAP